MTITHQPSGGKLLPGRARDVGALAGVFDETAKLNPPDLTKLRVVDKLAALQELMDSTPGRLSAMLADLRKVEEARIIEDITVEQGGQS